MPRAHASHVAVSGVAGWPLLTSVYPALHKQSVILVCGGLPVVLLFDMHGWHEGMHEGGREEGRIFIEIRKEALSCSEGVDLVRVAQQGPEKSAFEHFEV